MVQEAAFASQKLWGRDPFKDPPRHAKAANGKYLAYKDLYSNLPVESEVWALIEYMASYFELPPAKILEHLSALDTQLRYMIEKMRGVTKSQKDKLNLKVGGRETRFRGAIDWWSDQEDIGLNTVWAKRKSRRSKKDRMEVDSEREEDAGDGRIEVEEDRSDREAESSSGCDNDDGSEESSSESDDDDDSDDEGEEGQEEDDEEGGDEEDEDEAEGTGADEYSRTSSNGEESQSSDSGSGNEMSEAFDEDE